jgi:hypothetical protein
MGKAQKLENDSYTDLDCSLDVNDVFEGITL